MPHIFRDGYTGDDSGVDRGKPRSDRAASPASAVLTEDLAGAATWTSQWYNRSPGEPTIFAHFIGSAAADLYVETSWTATGPHDASATVHDSFKLSATDKTAQGLAKFVAKLEYRIYEMKYRFKVVNGGAAQVGAQLYAGHSAAE